ncbi:MAG: LysE family translocator [Pseudomonadota bacterium]
MTDYSLFTLAFAASAAAPGPEIAAVVSRVLDGGIKAGFTLAAGIIIGKLLMLSAALLGLAALFSVLGPWFAGIKFLGAAYLLYLGIRKWTRAGRIGVTAADARLASRTSELMLGMAMTLSNPVAIMFYLALLPGVLEVQQVNLQAFLLLCCIITGVMTVVVIGYGSLAEFARRSFSFPDAKTRIDRSAAAMMLGAALLIALR